MILLKALKNENLSKLWEHMVSLQDLAQDTVC